MRLLPLSNEHRAAFVELARDYEAAGEHRYASALQDFDAYVRRLGANRHGDDLPPGYVPAVTLWLEDDERLLGRVTIRLGLTPDLEKEGGHIGYDVRPSARRQGHGTTLLRLALVEARSLGLDRVLLTCDDDNAGSIAVIDRNAGVLTGRAISDLSGKPIRQYWIEL